jgi:hypothetical protein
MRKQTSFTTESSTIESKTFRSLWYRPKQKIGDERLIDAGISYIYRCYMGGCPGCQREKRIEDIIRLCHAQSWHVSQPCICHSILQSKQTMRVGYTQKCHVAHLLVKDSIVLINVGNVAFVFVKAFTMKFAFLLNAVMIIMRGSLQKYRCALTLC